MRKVIREEEVIRAWQTSALSPVKRAARLLKDVTRCRKPKRKRDSVADGNFQKSQQHEVTGRRKRRSHFRTVLPSFCSASRFAFSPFPRFLGIGKLSDTAVCFRCCTKGRILVRRFSRAYLPQKRHVSLDLGVVSFQLYGRVQRKGKQSLKFPRVYASKKTTSPRHTFFPSCTRDSLIRKMCNREIQFGRIFRFLFSRLVTSLASNDRRQTARI